ncbi:MAG: presenilin family intramembrane aspartyl protease PSH [Thermoplasmatota archaeon]
MAGKTEESSPEEIERPKFESRQAVVPIAMMVLFFMISISLALYIAPFYEALGYSSAFGDEAQNPLWAFAFLGMVIVVAVVILLLRKLLKRRRLKLKYVIGVAVAFSTMFVLTPLIDIAVNGSPDVWELYKTDLEGTNMTFPLDPLDIGSGFIVMSDTSFRTLVRGRYDIREADAVTGLDKVFAPHYKDGIWLASGTKSGTPLGWTVHPNGTIDPVGPFEAPDGNHFFLGSQVHKSEGVMLAAGFWENDTGAVVSITQLFGNEETLFVDLSRNETDIRPVQGWTFFPENYYMTSDGLHGWEMKGYGQGANWTSFDTRGTANPTWNVTWRTCQGNHIVSYIGPYDPYGSNVTPHPANSSFFFKVDIWGKEIEWRGEPSPTSVFYSEKEDGSYILDILEIDSYHRIDGDGEESVETVTDDVSGLFRDGDTIWIVERDGIWEGEFSFKERNQWYITISAIVLTLGLIYALFRKPKWWLVDLGGLLMGAGVIAMMGISFPISFMLLLLVLLAVYDAVAVYKTKHMIALADSVVEAKMPILLVFPMKWSYRYEDETNLMDPKRKRQSLFMGLGDVIIPGVFILSINTWLSPAGGTRLFGVIYPPLGVAIFSFVGMMIGFGILMRWVIKGKAHAGLPPLNGGTILGFLIGYLILYGTIVFW